eukprot:395548-Pelagomonas_calceolata.AAC.6
MVCVRACVRAPKRKIFIEQEEALCTSSLSLVKGTGCQSVHCVASAGTSGTPSASNSPYYLLAGKGSERLPPLLPASV